jgi:hypothetical protein
MPGDVFVFSGIDAPSTVVKLATSSKYVHVAIVLSVCQSSPSSTQADPILIAESHIDISLPSVGTGRRTLGVQTQWLSKRLATVHGSVWWAALKTTPEPINLQQMQAWLLEAEKQRIPYDFPQAIATGLPLLDQIGIEIPEDYSALFCSELVTHALQLAGVLDESINPSEQTPTDVMQFPCFKPLILIQDDQIKLV